MAYKRARVFCRVFNHEAKPSDFRSDETRPASLLNGFKKHSTKKRVSLESEQRFKLSEENITVQEL